MKLLDIWAPRCSSFLSVILALGAAACLSDCSRKVSLSAVKVAESRVESTVTTTTSGTVDAEQQAVLGFNAIGRVSRINVRAGEQVKKDQILAELDNRDVRTIFEQASEDHGRAQKLFTEGLISKSAVDDARKALEIAKSSFERSVIRSPFEGLITELNLQVGELSSGGSVTGTQGKAPLRMVDLKPRLIKGEIDESDISRVRVGMIARVKVLAVGKDIFAATVSQVVPFVGSTREQDRTSQIDLRFKELPNVVIPVGASADIEIVTEVKDKALAIPTRSLSGPPSDRSVFLVVDGKLSKRSVKTGIGNYNATEVVSGLALGDVISLPSDAFELSDGMKAKVTITPWP